LGELRGGALGAARQARPSTPNGEKGLVLGSNHELAPLAASAGLKWKGLRGRKSRPGTGREGVVTTTGAAVAAAATAKATAAAASAQLSKMVSSQQPRSSMTGSTAASGVGRISSALGRTNAVTTKR
jgi:hypothetical protein